MYIRSLQPFIPHRYLPHWLDLRQRIPGVVLGDSVLPFLPVLFLIPQDLDHIEFNLHPYTFELRTHHALGKFWKEIHQTDR